MTFRHPELDSTNFCTAFMPDSEQIEAFGTEFLCRNTVSVEEIQEGSVRLMYKQPTLIDSVSSTE